VEEQSFIRQQQLARIPLFKAVFILVSRLREQGLRTTWLWFYDKIARRQLGYSPREISQVAPGLFVGGQHRKVGLARMRAAGIQAVVNLRREYDDAAHGVRLDGYLWLPTSDDYAIVDEDLQRGADFIREQLAAGRGVYIHCASGVGRAPLMTAAYLVTTGMTAEEAWATVRRGRPFIRPTPPQIQALAHFAEQRNRAVVEAQGAA